jgi:hypothetical protein
VTPRPPPFATGWRKPPRTSGLRRSASANERLDSERDALDQVRQQVEQEKQDAVALADQVQD